MVVSYHIGAGNRTRVLWRSHSASAAEPLLLLLCVSSEVQLHLPFSESPDGVSCWSTSGSGWSLMTLVAPLMLLTSHWWNCLVPSTYGWSLVHVVSLLALMSGRQMESTDLCFHGPALALV